MVSSLNEVNELISVVAKGRDVRLIAVSKKQPFEKIQELYRQGHRDFGENYPQELVIKANQASASGIKDIRWHLIGHLQSNKLNQVLPWIASFHALDSLALAQKVSGKIAEIRKGIPLPVYVQVNIDQEESKGGFSEAEIDEAVFLISRLPGLKVEGLMTIPDPEKSREAFQKLKQLGDRLRKWTSGRLSMGMSSDFEAAILEGATDVRVGTLIFGSRNPGTGV